MPLVSVKMGCGNKHNLALKNHREPKIINPHKSTFQWKEL
jgi:hypothetical protein